MYPCRSASAAYRGRRCLTSSGNIHWTNRSGSIYSGDDSRSHSQVFRQALIEEIFPVVKRLWIGDGPLDQLLLHVRSGPQVENQGLVCQYAQHLGVIDLADAATGIVEKMIVAVDFVRLADEFRNVLHGR